MGISQIPLGYILGRTLVILPFIVLASLAAPWKGYAGIGFLFVRAILCLMMLILLTNTTRFVELLRGLRKLGCPQILVMNLGFLYRYLFVLTEEAMRMKQARDCRRVGRAPFREELKILSSMTGNSPDPLIRTGRENAFRHVVPRLYWRFPGGFAEKIFVA